MKDNTSASSAPNYSKTLRACYLGFITQAIAANFMPLLFTTFNREYGIPLGQIALVSTVFYLTQPLVDVVCAKFVDRVGYRVCVVASEVISAVGLAGLAFVPDLLPDPFVGIMACAIVYAIGSGLIEVLVSPIVEACPFPNKESVMSLLHSFYCWGSVGVIAGSTLFFAVAGVGNWRILACLWALIPAYNVYNFLSCPIERLVEEGEGMGIRQLMRNRTFWTLCILMVGAGASEIAMAQWASAFAETALGVSKTVGDIAGPCAFAVFMGVSRSLYGKFGARLDLRRFMVGSGILCVACYLLAGLSPLPVLGLVGCALCGFSVGIMWPGAISISSQELPLGGTAMFALLALAGDAGGSVAPSLVGNVAQLAGGDLHVGVLSGLVFPVVLVACMAALARRAHR